MMTTAAGTIRPAKALVLGAGIAGLQAIGTARRRLGAVVTAYDVRPASQGEVESLGAKFLDLGLDFSKGQGEGGYARALSAEEQAQQQAAVDEKAAGFDIIITTAKVPGRKPPVLLTAAGVGWSARAVPCHRRLRGQPTSAATSRAPPMVNAGHRRRCHRSSALPYLATERRAPPPPTCFQPQRGRRPRPLPA